MPSGRLSSRTTAPQWQDNRCFDLISIAPTRVIMSGRCDRWPSTALLFVARVKAQEPDEGAQGCQETNRDAEGMEVMGRASQAPE